MELWFITYVLCVVLYLFIGVIVSYAIVDDFQPSIMVFWPIPSIGLIFIGIMWIAKKIGQWIHRKIFKIREKEKKK